jgi:DNA-binding CsgD family transcriptional regulator
VHRQAGLTLERARRRDRAVVRAAGAKVARWCEATSARRVTPVVWSVRPRRSAVGEDTGPVNRAGPGASRAQVCRAESFGHRRIRRPDGSTRDVEFAMRATRAGGTAIVLAVCIHERPGGRSDRAHEPAPLTAREQEIVHRIALGEVTPEICAALHIAPDTVRSHVRNAMAKTRARTRAQLIAIALTEGLVDA